MCEVRNQKEEKRWLRGNGFSYTRNNYFKFEFSTLYIPGTRGLSHSNAGLSVQENSNTKPGSPAFDIVESRPGMDCLWRRRRTSKGLKTRQYKRREGQGTEQSTQF